MASCSSTHKSNSSTYIRKSTKGSNGNSRFIDGISINAGKAEKAKYATSSKKTAPKHIEIPEYASGNNSIESASDLQVKYAVRLNTPVENVTDIDLLQLMEHWWGTPYQLGGTSESGIDCSALCQTFLQDLYHLSIPRNSQQQFNNATQVDISQVRQGDLVFFGSGKNISHVGMYITNNKFVHASTSQGVMISDLNDPYWKPRFQGAGRYTAGVAHN